MSRRMQADPLRAILALEDQVSQARTVLQQTTEAHPAFERRVKTLVHLMAQRNSMLSDGVKWGSPPGLPAQPAQPARKA